MVNAEGGTIRGAPVAPWWMTMVLLGLILSGGCEADAPTDPEPTERDPARLETAELLSGGTGILVSNAFSGLVLRPAVDATNTPVPERWENLRVTVGGRPTDVRRASADRIEFDVPVLPAGSYGVDVAAGDASVSLSTRIMGVLASSSLGQSSGCSFDTPIVLIPVDAELVIDAYCGAPTSPTDSPPFYAGRSGYATFKPLIPGSTIRWIDGLYVDDPSRTSGTLPGPSARPGHFVASRPGAESSPPDTWVWRAGIEPRPVEPIECFTTPDNYSGTAVAEVAPGICLAYQHAGIGHRSIWRNGELLVSGIDAARFDNAFVLAADGWSALRGPGEILVFDDAANLVVRDALDGSSVQDAGFDGEGKVYLVQRTPGAESDVLQVRDRSSGEVLRSTTIPGSLEALSVRDGLLWVVRSRTPGADDLRAEVYDVDTLDLIRSVVISGVYLPFAHFFASVVGESPVIQVGPVGRRAVVTGWSSHTGIRSHVVEVFSEGSD